ncbi:MAG: hypothetical protein Q7N50_14130 [Armatimonadota bacterium]|nr:hypothetical protein [Armatimonadota bacterium]
MRNLIRLVVSIAFCAAVLSGTVLADAAPAASGVFVDKDGQSHAWRVNESHALIWDESPYLPVGFVFKSAYLQAQADENWQSDVKTLESLKAKGVTDILVRAGGPATSIPPEVWQKLIAYLDEQGFKYGIEIADGPKTRAAGFVISPRKYKLPNVTNGQMELSIPGVRGGFFITAEPNSGAILDGGVIRTSGDKAVLNVRVDKDLSPTLVVFPAKGISTDSGVMPDVWLGSDEYRDRLMDFLNSVKFGKGLRFLIDPFDGGMAPTGEMAAAIPDSPGFRIEFEGWLSLKYKTPEELFEAWGISRGNKAAYDVAARLLPLWWEGRGVSYVYDRASDQYLEADTNKSGMWRDILEFRDSSIQQYMNSVADALKRFGADVPVVFTADSYNRVFANSRSDGGFDGLSASIFSDSDEDTASAGQAYALTLEAGKTSWFIGTGVAGADTTNLPKAMSRLNEIGAKGFFISAPEGTALDTLAGLKSRLVQSADYSPEILYYPSGVLTGAHVKKLDYKTWWLPTLRNGELVQFGDNIFGYKLSGDMRIPAESAPPAAGSDKQTVSLVDGVCLWSNNGQAAVTIKLWGRQFAVSAANQSAAQYAPKKDLLTLRLSDMPVVIYGLSVEQLFPMEIARSEIDMLEKALAILTKTGAKAPLQIAAVGRAKNLLNGDYPLQAYNIAASNLNELAATFNSYIWMEGESSRDHSFDGTSALIGSSGAGYLKLDMPDDHPLKPYSAAYSFSAQVTGSYDLWIAAAPPGQSSASDLQFSIDGAEWQPVSVTNATELYAGSMTWFKAGSATLSSGAHTLTIQVVRPKAGEPYSAAIDVVLLARRPFTPRGPEKPSGIAP